MCEPKECEIASFPVCAIFWHALQQFRKLIYIPCCKLVLRAAVKAEERHESPQVF